MDFSECIWLDGDESSSSIVPFYSWHLNPSTVRNMIFHELSGNSPFGPRNTSKKVCLSG